MAGLKTVAALAVLFVVAVVAAGVASMAACNCAARRPARQAHEQLRVGQDCAGLLQVAEQFADDYSIERAKVACRVGYDTEVPLSFTRGISLTYLFTVRVAHGRISSVSKIGAY